MNSLISSRVDHQGKTFIIGHAGRLYKPHTSVDTWGRTQCC